jgi:hypothetical protein
VVCGDVMVGGVLVAIVPDENVVAAVYVRT